MINKKRRLLLKTGLLVASLPAVLPRLAACNRSPAYTLQPADDNGVRLPKGFQSRVVARSGLAPLAGSDFVWHGAPDGGGCLPDSCVSGGWVYVSNSELRSSSGGAGALKFNASGELIDAYSILSGTTRNCAGGMTPWRSWLSCEETDIGRVWECDPFGLNAATERPAMGVFNHEAVVVDPIGKQLYMTEDKPDGGLYRFTPENYPDLSSGLLEVAIRGDSVAELAWQQVPDALAKSQPTRYQLDNVRRFNGGEGMVYDSGKVYFTTKGDDRIWCYRIAGRRIDVVYDAAKLAKPVLTGVDNITIDGDSNLYVAEDGGDMQVVIVTPQGEVRPIAQIDGHARSEVTGVAFSPDGSRLYFSSQRGSTGSSADGLTYEIRGGF